MQRNCETSRLAGRSKTLMSRLRKGSNSNRPTLVVLPLFGDRARGRMLRLHQLARERQCIDPNCAANCAERSEKC